MTKKADWEKFFDGHAPVYMENSFTTNTMNEVDFLVEELRLKRGATVLDVGCGTGRHAIELARRGFVVTGVDLSSGMLAEARKAKVAVTWVHGDAARMPVEQQFDAVICLCEAPSACWDVEMTPSGNPWRS
jgi:ubiquinone/menaquinone biosynthesis C-methylase UbiE